MKSAFLLFFILLGYATIARGQGDPATNLKGQAASGLGNSASTIVVPNQQSTKLNAYQAHLETGNKNLLINPSFEHGTVSTGWTTSVTGTSVATITPNTTTELFGNKSGYLECVGGASGGTCTYYQDVLTSYPLDGMVSIYLKSSSQSGVKLIKRVNTVNSVTLDPNDSKTYQDIVNNPAHLKIAGAMGTTHTGIAIEITVAASETITVTVDEAFVGVQDVKQDFPKIESQSSYMTNSTVYSVAQTFRGPLTSENGSGLYSYNSSSGVYTALKKITLNISCSAKSDTSSTPVIYARINGSLRAASHSDALADRYFSTSTTAVLEAGDTFDCFNGFTNPIDSKYASVSATTADNTQVLSTKADFFSTDTDTLTFRSSALTASSAVGDYNTYSYAINSNTKTICASAPSTLPNKTDGFLIYTRAYNAASTCGNPARVEIKIAPAGTSLPTLQTQIYKSTGKSIAGSLDYFIAGATQQSARGSRVSGYNELTGVLVVDLADNESTITGHTLIYSDGTGQTSGYLVINAQKAKTSAVMDLAEFDYVYVEAGGSSGSAFSSGVTDINFTEIEDSTNSWSGTQFTVPMDGVYSISMNVQLSASVDLGFDLYVNGSQVKRITDRKTGVSHKGSYVGRFSKGQVVSFRSYGNGGTLGTSVTTQNLNIVRIPGQFK